MCVRFNLFQWKDFKDERGEKTCTDDFICDAAQGNVAVSGDTSCPPQTSFEGPYFTHV